MKGKTLCLLLSLVLCSLARADIDDLDDALQVRIEALDGQVEPLLPEEQKEVKLLAKARDVLHASFEAFDADAGRREPKSFKKAMKGLGKTVKLTEKARSADAGTLAALDLLDAEYEEIFTDWDDLLGLCIDALDERDARRLVKSRGKAGAKIVAARTAWATKVSKGAKGYAGAAWLLRKAAHKALGILGEFPAAELVHEGDYTVATAQQLADARPYTEITGNLVIESDAAAVVDLPNLRRVGGELRVTFIALNTITELRLPALESVDLLFHLDQLQRLAVLQAPKLARVGSLVITDADRLVNLDGLSGITSITDGTITVTGCSQLEDLDGLEKITGTVKGIEIADNTVLKSLSGLAGVDTVEGTVSFDGLTSVASLAGLGLGRVDGGLLVKSAPQIRDLTGLGSLQTIGGVLQVESCVSIENLAGLNGLGSVQGLVLKNNGSLTSLDGLVATGTLGQSLILEKCGALTNLDALEGIEKIGATLQLSSLLGLTNLDFLASLTEIGGDLVLSFNTSLLEADGLAAVTRIGGGIQIERNVFLASVEGLWNLLPDPTTGWVCTRFIVKGNWAAGPNPTGLTTVLVEEWLAKIGGAALVEGQVDYD